jgi:cation diffusion facilitator CzcD-associated flavoprotein CzcO
MIFDFSIDGGGVFGLAMGHKLLDLNPNSSILPIEKRQHWQGVRLDIIVLSFIRRFTMDQMA